MFDGYDTTTKRTHPSPRRKPVDSFGAAASPSRDDSAGRFVWGISPRLGQPHSLQELLSLSSPSLSDLVSLVNSSERFFFWLSLLSLDENVRASSVTPLFRIHSQTIYSFHVSERRPFAGRRETLG